MRGKRALVRVDFNVPVQDGVIGDETRLEASAAHHPQAGQRRLARPSCSSHPDRPKGKRVPSMSLKPVVAPLEALLGAPVAFAEDCVGDTAAKAVAAMQPGGVLLLQNLRFHPGEEADDPAFAQELAANGDLYVDDAFSAAHRAHASTEALAHLLPAYAGEAMRRELSALEAALGTPKRPVLGIVGGSKTSRRSSVTCCTIWCSSWTSWPSAAAWPTPSSSPTAGRSPRPIARRSWPRLRAASWPSPRRVTASCCCRSTPWWPRRP